MVPCGGRKTRKSNIFARNQLFPQHVVHERRKWLQKNFIPLSLTHCDNDASLARQLRSTYQANELFMFRILFKAKTTLFCAHCTYKSLFSYAENTQLRTVHPFNFYCTTGKVS